MLLGIPIFQLEYWRMEHSRNIAECWMKVMEYWLQGIPNYPATWEGLYELLEDVDFHEVAMKLKEVVASFELEETDHSEWTLDSAVKTTG